MEAKQRIVFVEDPYYGSEGLELAAAAIDGAEEPVEQVEDRLFARALDLMAEDLENELEMLADYLNESEENPARGNHLVARGSAGSWNGTSTGLTVYEDLGELLNGRDSMLMDCEIGKIWDENGSLFIHGYHHDGAVDLEVRQLTDEGEAVYGELGEAEDILDPITLSSPWNAEDSPTFAAGDEAALFAEMWDNPRYAARPRYVEREFGCPREEWTDSQELRVNEVRVGGEICGLLVYAGSPHSETRYAEIRSTAYRGDDGYSLTLGSIDYADQSSAMYPGGPELDALASFWSFRREGPDSDGGMPSRLAMENPAFRDYAVTCASLGAIGEGPATRAFGLDLAEASAIMAGHLGMPLARLAERFLETGLAPAGREQPNLAAIAAAAREASYSAPDAGHEAPRAPQAESHTDDSVR